MNIKQFRPVHFLLLVLLVSGFCSRPAVAMSFSEPTGVLPEDWYALPENIKTEKGILGHKEKHPQELDSEAKQEALGALLDTVYQTDVEAMESIPESPHSLTATGLHPKDWVPWHFGGFGTDLGLTASGLIGVLTLKGTAGITAYFRRQGEKPAVAKGAVTASATPESEESRNGAAPAEDPNTVVVNPNSSGEDLDEQIAPIIKAAAATGKISNLDSLRTNLKNTTEQFQDLTRLMEQHTQGVWWVSGFRTDLVISASGKVLPTMNVGGELRFRLDWKRIKGGVSPHPIKNASRTSAQNHFFPIREQMFSFIDSMATALEHTADTAWHNEALKPYTFRFGVGLGMNGKIGLAKGAGSLVGQINFSRNTKKPTVYPWDKPKLNLFSSAVSDEAPVEMISIIDSNPQPEHLQYAKEHGVPYEQIATGNLNSSSSSNSPNSPNSPNSKEQVIYKITAEQMTQGLVKAIKIGNFFASHAGKAESRRWKLYDYRVFFDMSLTGSLGVVGLTGLATTEINFYNQNF